MPFLLESGSWAAIVPHAPLLLPGINANLQFPGLLQALSLVRDRQADLVVLISPHGPVDAVYEGRGSLAAMGLSGFDTHLHADPRWSQRLRDLTTFDGIPRADHGITVPLLLDAIPDAPLVCCALRETTGPGKAFTAQVEDAAERLVQAILVTGAGRRVGVILSAHTSAALSPAAPLTERTGGREFEARFQRRLEADVASVAGIDANLFDVADPCGRSAFRVLSRMFPGNPGAIHAYDDSTGVGYLVATVDAR